MEQQQIFRYLVAGVLAAGFLALVSVIAYVAWKDSRDGNQ